jgi:two-component system, OmpR family, response regulator NblR
MTTPSDHSPRVLVIEADEVLAQHVSSDLRESGYETAIAHDTLSSLRQVKEFSLL